MKPVVVSDSLAVGEFPTSDQLAILAQAGFKAIINNQPDGEVERFQKASDLAAQAERHGLAHAHAPLSSRTPPPDELARYGDALARLPSPIYAFCYSGARSAAGCALLLTRTVDVDTIVREFGEAGFELESLRPWLDEAREGHAGPAPAKPAAAVVSTPAAAAPDGVHKGNGNGAHGNGAPAGNGAGVAEQVEARPVAAPVAAVARPEIAASLPRMVVVQPRAAGYGGFAI